MAFIDFEENSRGSEEESETESRGSDPEPKEDIVLIKKLIKK
ncbi:hypothetical protein ES705_41172 [subsurface metagenome]